MPNQLFHKFLNLTGSPLKAAVVLETGAEETHNHYSIHRPEDILSDTLLKQFAALNLTPSNVALFYKIPTARSLIHYDVGYIDGKWKKNIAAINWNLTGSESTMCWYEVNEVEVEPDPNPQEETPPWYFSLNGVHFGYRRNMDIPDEKLRRLESAEIYGPTLVRTDIAHAVVNADKTGRWALSVRFDPDFQSWEHAVSALAPVTTPTVAAAESH